LGALPAAVAQGNAAFALDPSPPAKERSLPDRLPEKPSLPPAMTIPVEPLGFTPPGPIYLGQQNTLVSLDFLDENRLLFTFRVPGLMHRETGDSAEGVERQIRALVLTLPAGTVQAEALWTVHDRARYLWMLKDGHFLFRDRESLQQGDAALDLKPFLRFPGPLLLLGLDPSQHFLVTQSREPAEAANKPGEVPSPATSAATLIPDGQKPSKQAALEQPDVVVRILRRDSGQVMLVSRTRATVHLAINPDGYLESLRGNGEKWVLNLNYFSGGSAVLGHFDSACSPTVEFISEREALATACSPSGGHHLVAMDTGGRRLWESRSSSSVAWPLLVRSAGGLRFARETVVLNRSANDYSRTLDAEDVKGQLVRVFDAADGNPALEAPASPVLDAGGNVAVSPSGGRVAVLNGGAIQVFELPSPPSLPESGSAETGR
jgi:hypothetical protein